MKGYFYERVRTRGSEECAGNIEAGSCRRSAGGSTRPGSQSAGLSSCGARNGCTCCPARERRSSRAAKSTVARALPYVMAVVTMLLTSILQSAISSIATNYRFDGGLVSDPVLFNALPWIQTLLSGLLGLVLPIVAGLITYKKFRPALRFWLILLGAQTILLLPQNVLNLVFAVLTARSTAVLFASLVNGLHVLFSLLAPALACLMLWYFDRKAE